MEFTEPPHYFELDTKDASYTRFVAAKDYNSVDTISFAELVE